MKKIIIALMCAIGSMVSFANETTNVYNMTMSLQTPILQSGVRNKVSQSYKGYMYMVYDEDGKLSTVWADVLSNKTKVGHVISFNEGFYHLIGKTTKTSPRSVANMYLTGADDEVYGGISKYGVHEKIKVINFGGFGTIKSSKTVVIGCGACGAPEKTTEYCNILNAVSGHVNGVMDCECPEDEDWWHTVMGGLCGVWYDAAFEMERSHEAAFTGTWKISYNKKLSATK